jgi:hypothetical protein
VRYRIRRHGGHRADGGPRNLADLYT